VPGFKFGHLGGFFSLDGRSVYDVRRLYEPVLGCPCPALYHTTMILALRSDFMIAFLGRAGRRSCDDPEGSGEWSSHVRSLFVRPVADQTSFLVLFFETEELHIRPRPLDRTSTSWTTRSRMRHCLRQGSSGDSLKAYRA